jgi:hypothetical protein
VIFDYQNGSLLETCKLSQIIEYYSAFDVKIRNIKEVDDKTDLHIPVTLKAALSLMNGDKDAKYVSEKNGDFLEETGIIKNYKYNDSFLRPPMVSNCFYDFLTASQNAETPLQYSVNYRNFYLVTHGVIKIKLIPPKSARYLYPVEDYDNFEFRSPLNPWAIQRQYKADYDKIKTLEIELTLGKIIYIPAYWWYSIKFMEVDTSVCVFKYRTYMNTVAILPKLCMKTLQRQNTKREIVKKVHFQKNETAKIMVENDKERGKGVQIPKLPHIISPVLANVESSRLDLNSNALEGTDYMQNSEESKEVDAVTLSLIDVAD